MPLNCQQLSLTELIIDTLQAQVPLADFKQISLERSIPTNLPIIKADADLIGRVLQNLIDNAIKFTPQNGTVSVTVTLPDQSQAETENLMVAVSITDSGPGIPPQIQHHLFEKFVSGSQAEAGSGLGLAFCKLAIEAHNGNISVDSHLDDRTTFTFTLPAVQLP
jgi:signal transduction histidine kinase